MARKHIMVTIDTEKLTPENRTSLIEMCGRSALDDALSEASEIRYTDSEIGKMSDAEFSAKREDILDALSKNQIKK